MSYRNTHHLLGTGFCCLALLVFGIGCNKDAGAPAAGGGGGTQAGHDHDHDHDHDGDHDHDHDHGQAGADQEASIEEALAKLSDEDRALAEKQQICPVGGEPLGSMGTPVKLTIEGRDVLICCEACEKPLREDPEKYFAKLDSE